jgi:hypothetical protein
MTPPAEFAPVFDWSPPRGRKVSLISFIAASAALHAFCFYIFQIIYPPTVALLPPPARVSIVAPNSEEGRLLFRWIESEDPALVSTTQRPPEAGFPAPPKPEHVPSYLTRQPALKEVPPYPPDLRVPSSQPPGPVPLPRTSVPAAAGITPTTLKVFSPTELLGAPIIPPLRFNTSSEEPPQSAEFRIALGPGGDVRYCFVKTSSGDSALDEQARRHVLLCRFPAIANRKSQIENSLVWAIATIEWGTDLATPLVSPAENPRP